MMFETLEFLIGGKMRVFVIETDNETNVNKNKLHMINERTTVSPVIKSPSDGMGNETGAFLGEMGTFRIKLNYKLIPTNIIPTNKTL